MLAGESQSLNSLPFLEDATAVARLQELGFVSLVLEILGLHGLNSVTTSVGCRAISYLDHSAIDLFGVEVLLREVHAVNRPFAFAVLASLARQRAEVCEHVRGCSEELGALLLKFSEDPSQFSSPDNPAALSFFLTVWTMEELEKELTELGGRQATIDVLKSAHSRRISPSIYMDLFLPLIGGVSDLNNARLFMRDKQFDFCLMLSTAIVATTIATTMAMAVRKVACWKLGLNIITVGSVSIMSEAWRSIQTGFKSDELIGLKMMDGVGSFVSFSVGVYSILMCGYLEHYKLPGNFTLASRWASICAALVSLPLGTFYIIRARLQYGVRQFGDTYAAHSASSSSQIMLFIFQAAEIWSFITVLIFELAARPDTHTRKGATPFEKHKLPLFILLGVQVFVMFCAWLVNSRGRPSFSAIAPLGLNMFFNIGGGATSDLRLISRAVTVLRLVTLAVLWCIIAKNFAAKPELLEHFKEVPSCTVLLVIAGTGSMMLVFATLQQFFAGRWSFDGLAEGRSMYTPLTKQNTTASLARVPSTKLVGIYQSTNHAPEVAKSRWQQVHEKPVNPAVNQLPDASARVPKDNFIEFHSRMENADVNNKVYIQFVESLFATACALMFPKDVKDVGRHCFGYATLLHDEFHQSEPPDKMGLMKMPAISWFDPLSTFRANLENDWRKAEKNHQGYVPLEYFQAVLLARHEPKLGGVKKARKAYEDFLSKLFMACRLLGGVERRGLDKHAFVYASMFAYEFYFSDAREKVTATRCGGSTPVADTFHITK
eukprot:TRINITY_DN104320_c0_g1_i1.p1 TRINITY_DN104320_c0_g1~~TRINITY_DN104320_c0_g1_i1.p1  ORF type:complete len:872 (-),score=128.09 TRINITY_DN104320_c0_g1_i1:46-2367(-)